ncbi:MAG TPA: MotA/TolQ/ExbB proton channel family protein [Elusimicrobiota bacterium]|jgi:chemotaxis protein MotA|nr:MotA/TolQ/ExbB proton channel family protein [Elusimicrobiota bacterium]
MDIATIAGIVVFLGLTVTSIYVGEGVAGFKPFLNLEALIMVMGGTICATLVNYPLSQVVGVGRVIKKTLMSHGEDTSYIVVTFVNLSQKAKKEGFLALQNDVKAIKSDFLRRGVQLVVDGADHEFIRNMLETELGFIRERHKVGQEILNAMGTYSPAFGIIGTVLGMILMLSSIDDVAQVPRRMALALAAAFYGLGSGYLIFLPMGGKLRRRSEEELLVKEIIIRGVLLLQSGATPSVVEANLKAYLAPSDRLIVKTAPAAAPAAAPAPGAPAA